MKLILKSQLIRISLYISKLSATYLTVVGAIGHKLNMAV